MPQTGAPAGWALVVVAQKMIGRKEQADNFEP